MGRDLSKQAISFQAGAAPDNHDHATMNEVTDSVASHARPSSEPPAPTKLTPIPDGVLTKIPMGVSGKRNHSRKYARRAFDYEFCDLSEGSESLFKRLTNDRFIADKTMKVSWHPRTKATGFYSIIRLEELMWTVVRQYERDFGGALRCMWVVAAGKSGQGRAQALMVFQEHPNMMLLKTLCRKLIGDCRVIGVYDSSEDWRKMSMDRKNNPPHDGCLHHLAKHVGYPGHVFCERNVLPDGDLSRAPKAPVCSKRDEKGKKRRCPEAKLRKATKRRQRTEDDAAWLARNERLPC